MQVKLIYTGLNMDTNEALPPEVFHTYEAETLATQRDPMLRNMLAETLADGQPRVLGGWSTEVVAD